MQTKPGRQDDYIRELERLYVPWSESHRQALARLVHHDLPVQRGHPLLGARRRLGLLREPLPVVEGQPTGRDRHLDERRARAARRLGGLDPAGPAPVAAAVSARSYRDAGILLRSVRSGGDGRPAAVLPGAARRASGVLRREVGHLRAVPVRRHLAGAGDQRRNVRRIGGDAARRNGSGRAQRRAGAGPAAASHAVSRQLRRPDLRRASVGAPRASSGRDPSPSSPNGSAPWPTNGSTNCCRAAPST